MNKTAWNAEKINDLFEKPFMELIFEAQKVHRAHFNPCEVQLSTLLSIKTGTCPEDCAYCPQSGHYNTGLQKENLIDISVVIEKAKQAKQSGATRFCMGAAWKNPPKKEFPKVLQMIKAVKDMGLESCVTLGTLDKEQSQDLKEAGLDYYNHNLDSSPDYYKKIITTRTFEERLETLDNVRNSGINVCCGGIIGMGEKRIDRVNFLLELVKLPKPPESVPINRLMAAKGTPLENTPLIDNFEFIKTVAIARIMMPTSFVRLSAGRDSMSEEMQTLCYMAGANSIFAGDKLLTCPNPETDSDNKLLSKLGMRTMSTQENHVSETA